MSSALRRGGGSRSSPKATCTTRRPRRLTVADLDVVTAFFVALDLEVEGRTFVEGGFLDTVCGIPDSRTEIVMLKPPDDGTRLEPRIGNGEPGRGENPAAVAGGRGNRLHLGMDRSQ